MSKRKGKRMNDVTQHAEGTLSEEAKAALLAVKEAAEKAAHEGKEIVTGEPTPAM